MDAALKYLGWQGGTIWQVQKALEVKEKSLIQAYQDEDRQARPLAANWMACFSRFI